MKYNDNANAINGLTKFLYLVVGIAVLGALLRFISHLDYFNIQTVDMVNIQSNLSLQHVDKEKLFERIKPYLSGSSFYVDLDEAHKVVLGTEWVADAQIEKIMPNTVQIIIKEQEPIAKWIQDGKVAGLVNSEGAVFNAHYEKPLPEFDGSADQLPQMVEQYQLFASELKPARLSISRLQYTPRASWSMMLNNGIEVRLGKNEVDTRLNRFVRVWRQYLSEQAKSLDYVDMRYSDGLATRTRSGSNSDNQDNPDNPDLDNPDNQNKTKNNKK